MGSTPVSKIRELDEETPGAEAPTIANILRCTLHSRAIAFATFDEYDAHYQTHHVNRCHECNKNFPSDHILNLHIEECHDSFVAALREKGEHTFSCFVEGCDRKCRDPAKRRRHLIDKHSYPPNFFFDVTKHGIEGRLSLLCDTGSHRRIPSRREKPSSTKDSAASGDGEAGRTATADWVSGENVRDPRINKGSPRLPQAEMGVKPGVPVKDVEMDMDLLSSNMSSLKLVPRSISFGRGGRKGFARS